MNEVAIAPAKVWDRYAIKAEINRRGMTLTGIARAHGLAENACRKALLGTDRKGADAIASALDIPFAVLFPTGFLQSRSSEHEATAKRGRESRQKRAASPDIRAAAR